ncbi:Uncharacterized protein OBRU01_07886 [Operophtera brumata]|uniref:InaF motif containing 2 n=1 Tax=Operophtera brumata TaxID=104452 RepID=A0A0L7LJ37_OPEBR|nr:Uncharacterized protein OBRU01_07886 [Operophtera brumata]
MSVCGQSGQPEEDSGSEEVTAAAAAVRDLYKKKPVSKVVRVLTVLAYLLSVSLAAILLSVYYVCVWKSPELPPLNDTDPAASRLSALRGGVADYAAAAAPHNATGKDYSRA